VVARLTRAGAREVRKALDAHRNVSATVTVTLPGAKLRRKLRLAP
jgi:hypothetical protein